MENKKNLIVGVSAAATMLVGGLYYSYSSKNLKIEETPTQARPTEKQTETAKPQI
jgi:hypothetical protein